MEGLAGLHRAKGWEETNTSSSVCFQVAASAHKLPDLGDILSWLSVWKDSIKTKQNKINPLTLVCVKSRSLSSRCVVLYQGSIIKRSYDKTEMTQVVHMRHVRVSNWTANCSEMSYFSSGISHGGTSTTWNGKLVFRLNTGLPQATGAMMQMFSPGAHNPTKGRKHTKVMLDLVPLPRFLTMFSSPSSML